MGKKLSSDEVLAGVLSYLGILFVIPLIIVKKRNEYVKFHLAQGITLFIAVIIFWVAMAVLGFITSFIPVFGILVIAILYIILILLGIFGLVALINGAMGNMWKIPVIYGLSKNFKL